MCQRSQGACQEVQRRVAEIRACAQNGPGDPIAWATDIARQAARLIRHVTQPDEVT
jgi:hypothetical protein